MAKRKERSIVSIIGRTNVGKSSMLNLLSGQKDYAIVDKTPGTTTDTVAALMEIHNLGSFKVLDTAGVDEYSKLGAKKRKKTYEAIEEADLSLIVLDLEQKDVSVELKLIERIRKYKKQGLIIYNLFNPKLSQRDVKKRQKFLDNKFESDFPSLVINAADHKKQIELTNFIKMFFKKETRRIDLLPIKKKGYVMLIIPMDEETPDLRLLRPQDMAVERLLRSYAIPVLYRMDLKKARSSKRKIIGQEEKRFLDVIKTLSNSSEGLKLIITDSQAFDVISRWAPKKIPFSSFSIMMTNYISFGNLKYFADSVKKVDKLKKGDKVLIVEACNHDRQCDDIATVQIPRRLEVHAGCKLKFDFSFGRPFPENISSYKLIIHCGACMIDRQKYLRRILQAKENNIPLTNYGVLLSYFCGKEILDRVVSPFLTDNCILPKNNIKISKTI